MSGRLMKELSDRDHAIPISHMRHHLRIGHPFEDAAPVERVYLFHEKTLCDSKAPTELERQLRSS